MRRMLENAESALLRVDAEENGKTHHDHQACQGQSTPLHPCRRHEAIRLDHPTPLSVLRRTQSRDQERPGR